MVKCEVNTHSKDLTSEQNKIAFLVSSVTNIFVKTYMFFQDILAYLRLNRNFIQTGPFRKPHKHMASYWTKA